MLRYPVECFLYVLTRCKLSSTVEVILPMIFHEVIEYLIDIKKRTSTCDADKKTDHERDDFHVDIEILTDD